MLGDPDIAKQNGTIATVQTLVGRWKLLSFDIARVGEELVAWRGGSNGQLEYTADGRMQVRIVGKNGPEDGEPQDINIIEYTGTFTLDEDGGAVRHQVETTNDVTRQDREMVRQVNLLERDKMLLTGERLGKRFALVWQKCE